MAHPIHRGARGQRYRPQWGQQTHETGQIGRQAGLVTDWSSQVNITERPSPGPPELNLGIGGVHADNVVRVRHCQPLRGHDNSNEICGIRGMQLLDHAGAVHLDGAGRNLQFMTNRLVHAAIHNQVWYLPLAFGTWSDRTSSGSPAWEKTDRLLFAAEMKQQTLVEEPAATGSVIDA